MYKVKSIRIEKIDRKVIYNIIGNINSLEVEFS